MLLTKAPSSHGLVLLLPICSPPPWSCSPFSMAFNYFIRIIASIKKDATASEYLAWTYLFCQFQLTFLRFLRRRHGIPDNDNRPFNVAYAAAKKALKEREAAAKGLSRRNNAPIPVIGGPAARQHVSVAPGPAASQSQATSTFPLPLSLLRSLSIHLTLSMYSPRTASAMQRH